MKICSNLTCQEVNPQSLDNFARKPKYKNGIYSQCRSCVNFKAIESRRLDPIKAKQKYKKDYDRNPKKARQKARLCRFKKKYWPELSLQEIDVLWSAMFAKQSGKCSICKLAKPLDVEHCHKTGKVRSLACNGCNTALARIHEDISIAQALIQYIEKHSLCAV